MCYVSRLRVLRYTTEWEQIKNQEHFKSFYNRRSLQIVYFKTFGPPISRSIFVFHACHVNRIKRENSTVRYRKKKQPNYSIIFIVLIFVWNIFRRFLKSFFFLLCKRHMFWAVRFVASLSSFVTYNFKWCVGGSNTLWWALLLVVTIELENSKRIMFALSWRVKGYRFSAFKRFTVDVKAKRVLNTLCSKDPTKVVRPIRIFYRNALSRYPYTSIYFHCRAIIFSNKYSLVI